MIIIMIAIKFWRQMHVTGTKRGKAKTGLLCWPSLISKEG